MKIMISGGTGQLGSECAQTLRSDHEVTALGSKDLDITNLPSLESMMKRLSPDVIMNCAAYTNVDGCETQKGLSWDLNVNGPKNLALCVKKYGGRLIHISTDYVFDGIKKPPASYVEDDEPHPLSYYGRTKLESEVIIRDITDQHIIVRTAWIYGIKGHNFLKTMLRLVLNNPHKEVKVVNDQFGSPTWTSRLAMQLAKLVESQSRGTYHATSEGYCTWYELANFFLAKMDVPHTLVPCSTANYPTPASRPKNSILENQRLKNEGINIMVHWQEDLGYYISNFREQLINEAKKERQ